MGLIAISVHREYRPLALRAGFDVFLEKPLDAYQLLEAVRRLLSGSAPNEIVT
jgi:DNA-binding response OmpR family regulator